MVTGEMVEELILSGADIIKVGIGPGKLVPWTTISSILLGGKNHRSVHSHFCHSPQALSVQLGRKLELGIHSSVQ